MSLFQIIRWRVSCTMSTEITDDMLRLLLVIKEYTNTDDDSSLDWVKELPLMAVIYQGIVDGLFQDYDYAIFFNGDGSLLGDVACERIEALLT